MSDEVTAAIEQSVADLKADQPDISSETTETAPEATAEEDTSQTAAPEQDEEAELSALEKELVTKTPTLQKGRINVSRHQAVLTRQRRQAEAERAELQKKYDALKPYEDPMVAARIRAFEISERDPDRFIQLLRSVPEYQTRLEKMVADELSKRAPAAPKTPEASEEEPKPNVLLQDGTLGYDAEGAKKLLEFRLRQAQKDFDSKFDSLRNDLKPIQEERETREAISQAFDRQGKILTNARQTWPDFAEHESAIREELAKPGNERIGLEEAYIRVVAPRLKGDRAKSEAEIHAKVVKEMAEKSRAGGSIRPKLPEVTTDPAAVDDTEAIIRESIRNLPR